MIKLLIVDDEMATREGLMQAVSWERLGIDWVRAVANGLEALQVCALLKPDIVLTDVKMPGMDGIELGIRLREAYPGLILLFLSSYADKAYLKSAIQLNALDYIEKPVNLEELEQHIGKAVSLVQETQLRQEKERVLQSVISEGLPLLREKLALQLIQKAESRQDSARLWAALGNSIPSGSGMAVVLLVLHTSEGALIRLQADKKLLLERLERCLADDGTGAVCGFKDSCHLVVHLYARWLTAPLQLTNLAGKIRSLVQQAAGERLDAFTGIGTVVYSPARLLESYQTAAAATQRQFFLGYNQVVAYQELDARSHTAALDPLLPEQLGRLLESGQEEAAAKLVSDFADLLRPRIDTLVNQVKNAFFELLMRLFREAVNKGISLTDQSDETGGEYIWNTITRFQTLQELESYVLERIAFFFRELRQKESGGSISFSIRHMVQRRYSDTDLSIKTLSDALFLTPNYLSLQFKKETGLTINQYITEYRMERAKELLRDRKRKLYDVALSVGFQDANYFTKSFKKVTGLTPSDFKEKYS